MSTDETGEESVPMQEGGLVPEGVNDTVTVKSIGDAGSLKPMTM